MKKLVLKLDLCDDKAKQKALKTVSGLQGIDFIGMDMKDKKMTVIGTVDPVSVVSKLRKHWQADIITVGPAKEPEKQEEPKKEEAKAEEPKKEEPKKEEPKTEKPKEEEVKKEEAKKEETKNGPEKEEKKKEVREQPDYIMAYRGYNPQMTRYYYVPSIEENPNACAIF